MNWQITMDTDAMRNEELDGATSLECKMICETFSHDMKGIFSSLSTLLLFFTADNKNIHLLKHPRLDKEKEKSFYCLRHRFDILPCCDFRSSSWATELEFTKRFFFLFGEKKNEASSTCFFSTAKVFLLLFGVRKKKCREERDKVDTTIFTST